MDQEPSDKNRKVSILSDFIKKIEKQSKVDTPAVKLLNLVEYEKKEFMWILKKFMEMSVEQERAFKKRID